MVLINTNRWEILGRTIFPETGESGVLVQSKKSGLYCFIDTEGFRTVQQTWAAEAHDAIAEAKGACEL